MSVEVYGSPSVRLAKFRPVRQVGKCADDVSERGIYSPAYKEAGDDCQLGMLLSLPVTSSLKVKQSKKSIRAQPNPMNDVTDQRSVGELDQSVDNKSPASDSDSTNSGDLVQNTPFEEDKNHVSSNKSVVQLTDDSCKRRIALESS
ncbi:hypothetical protein D918_07553 [Trichuris suis]|nr:hypothetical protein D918_07553 [Trichuris suis]